jgi:hypothetical protein
VDLDVGRVLELLRHPILDGIAVDDLLRLGDRPLHALGTLGEDELGAKRLEHAAALERHRLGHGQDDRVAARRRDERERDAGVSARGLHDGLCARAGGEDPLLLRVPNHGGADAALHGVGRVSALDLRDDVCAKALGHAVQANERRVTDAEAVVVVDAGHLCSFARRWAVLPAVILDTHPG